MGIVQEEADFSKERDDSNESEADNEEGQKEDKSSDVSFSDAIVDPGAVMIVLRDANIADIAMITSFRY